MSKVLGAVASALTSLCVAHAASAADQTIPGAGNAAAITLAGKSPMVRSARTFLRRRAASLHGRALREATLDAIDNSSTCILHRAGVDTAEKNRLILRLREAGLVDPADDQRFPGGLNAGVFPPLVDDGSACPKMPQSFFSAPGSYFGGHHSFPGGLAVHESFNEISSASLAAGYRQVYGHSNAEGVPEITASSNVPADPSFVIDDDVIAAAPLWHDWAKAIVFQWNADGTEFSELAFGGNGATDDGGAPGNSKTGAHHIIGLAETMKRGLPADFVVAQASAHSNPTSGNEYKVVNWLRAAAILAHVDPVARGYIRYDSKKTPRLAAVRSLGSIDLNAPPGSLPNLLIEYTTHHLSDADATFTGPALVQAQVLLAKLAPVFGYEPADAARYNTKYRNPALAYLTAERLLVLYADGGLALVQAELTKLRKLGVL